MEYFDEILKMGLFAKKYQKLRLLRKSYQIDRIIYISTDLKLKLYCY